MVAPYRRKEGRQGRKNQMRSLKERLEQSVTTLEKLERRREETHTPSFGLDTEWIVIQNELRELEANILDDPGALEKFLIRRPGQ